MKTCILTLLFLILSFFFTYKAYSSNSNLIYEDHISINCGSSATSSAALTGQEWLGDIHPNFTLKGSSSTRSTLSVDPVPYNTARISRSQFSYSFQLKPGQKFIRLLFNPTSYNDFKRFDDLFTVEAGPFTLLSNFSASATADALAVTTFAKEFCFSIHEKQSLNIVFSPATQHTYVFINGIEIISVPSSLDYCHGGDMGVRVVGHKSVIHIDNTTALEMVRRQNIKQDSVSLGDDVRAMFGMWATIRKQKSINQASNITWKVSVDVGFRYLIRLHFSDIGLKMAETGHKDFVLLINDTIATTSAEIFQIREDQGTLLYKNYMVMVNGHKREGKRDIFISLHSKDEILDRHGPLEGFEMFKLSNHDNSLASPTPLSRTRYSSSYTIQNVLSVLGLRNAIAAVVIAIVSLVNIIFHVLLKILGDDFHEEEKKPSTRAKQLCRRFSLAEMQSATDDFNDAFVIGRGGFGKVYKGRIDNGKVTVAIKRLKPNSKQGTREFWTEIETLSELRHVNLVSLIGYCNEQPEMILVYEYVPCGTLADPLYKLARKYDAYSSLSWKQRLEICIGAGRGLDYIHTGHRFIHRDIKASNILLDENFVAKVSDLGLAKIESGSEMQSEGSTNLKGTFGYIDPDYFKTRRITTKSDTYSFGVVLLEVLCGRPAVEPWIEEDKRSLTMWALDNISKGDVDQIVAPSLRGEILQDSLMTFVRITERCLHDEPMKRPAMVHVVINLEFALEQQVNGKSLVPNERASVADFFPFSSKLQQENANSLVPNEIMDVGNNLLYTASTRQLTVTSSIMKNGTEQTNSKTINAGTKDGMKTTVQKLSRRLWPWDAFRKTGKISKKHDPSNISISAPISRRTSNMTSRISTLSDKRVDRSNKVKSTPILVPKGITGDADFFPFPDKTQQENVNSSVPNEITNIGDALPSTDTTPASVSTTQLTMASSIMQNGTSPQTEQINHTTIYAGTKDVMKTTIHQLSRCLWPWDAFRKIAKSSKEKDSGNISISAPISRKTKNMTSRASTSLEQRVAGNETISTPKFLGSVAETNEMISNPSLKIFSFSELKVATRNFRADTVLGEGGFGRVFKGRLKEKHNSDLGSGTVVAIKKLNPEGFQGHKEWLSEVTFLGSLSHPNVVKLLGYCLEDEQLLLVYEFMQKFSLEHHLFLRNSSFQPLPWDIRLKILIGAARGLAFLHALDVKVIHRDFKPSNILLDESYNAKVSDFGLAKSGPMDRTHVSTQVMGTSGYAAPEYIATGHLYVKSDVYSFGVVLVEILTGLRVLDHNRPSEKRNLVSWIKPHLPKMNKLKMVMDSRLEGRYPVLSAFKVAQLALNCLEVEPKKRPSMEQVVETLERIQDSSVDKPRQPRVQFRDQPA